MSIIKRISGQSSNLRWLLVTSARLCLYASFNVPVLESQPYATPHAPFESQFVCVLLGLLFFFSI